MRVVVWLLTGLILLGIIYAFSTCRAEQSDGRTEIILFDWPNPNYAKMNNKRIALFEQKNPDIKVRLVTGYPEKWLAMFAGGVSPDVFSASSTNIYYCAKQNIILALDEFIANDNDVSLDMFFPITVEDVRYRGKIYALPEAGSPMALCYNKDMFDRHNREYPDRPVEYPNEKWTWADFRRAAKALTQDRDGDGQTDVYGTHLSFSPYRFPAYVWQNGGEVVSKDRRRCPMDSPEAIGAIRWMYEILWVDKSAPTAGTQFAGVSQQTQIILFKEQRIAMVAITRYAQFNLQEKTNFKWDIAPMPRGPVNRMSPYRSDVWMVSARTLYPRKAWRLVKFLVGDESSRMTMEYGRALTANRDVAEEMLRHPGVQPEHDHVWADAMSHCRHKNYEIVETLSCFDKASDEIKSVGLGLRTPEQACRNFARIYQEGLDVLWEKEGGL